MSTTLFITLPVAVLLTVVVTVFSINAQTTGLNLDVMNYIEEAIQNYDQIPNERKEALQELAQFVSTKLHKNEDAKLIFICTHNSRRSHMSQIWASVAAHYYQIPHIKTYSGGTEATAFNPRAVAALQRAGLEINQTTEGKNPLYKVQLGEDTPPLKAFSKKYDDSANPQHDFAAIMTCSQADEACPFVPGASFRLSLPYEDPKEADGTSQEASRYDERSRQIATEMLYCLSQVKDITTSQVTH
jgi:protein-tyrosine-phosphatase